MNTIKFFDKEFPNEGFNHTRKIVRAVVFNDKKEIALIKLYGDDIFGHRDYYETPGGGINPKENRHKALEREIEEEVKRIEDRMKLSMFGKDSVNGINFQNNVPEFEKNSNPHKDGTTSISDNSGMNNHNRSIKEVRQI